MSVLPPSPNRRTPGRVAGRLAMFGAIAAVGGLLAAGIAMPAVGTLALSTTGAVAGFEAVPNDLQTPPLAVRSKVLAKDGTSLATIYDQNRVEVSLDRISPMMQKAIVAIEDERFYQHNGVDPRGVLRALVTNQVSGGIAQGSSTLTMQYVKNVLLLAAEDKEGQQAAVERSYMRKIKEMRYAIGLEQKLSKDEILNRYLNIAYFGSGAHGVEAASRRYFSKSAAKLTLVEAATLAGIVQEPSRFDPLANPGENQKRRDVVLTKMAEQGYISQAQAAEAKAIKVQSYIDPSKTPNGCTTAYAPFFCDYVMARLKEDPALGKTPAEREKRLKEGGLTITTTLDPKAQKSAQEAALNAIPAKDDSKKATAIAMVEPGTGNILALAQNREWGTKGAGNTTYNYAVDQRWGGTQGMQAGSTFKMFTLVAALEKGIDPTTPIMSPEKKTFTGFKECGNDAEFPPYPVENSTKSGVMDMFRGTAWSVNTFFVELEKRAGLCRVVDVAERMGMTLANGQPLSRVPSFTLGSMEVSPLSLANAYATVAAHGKYCAPRVIAQITDRNGKKLPVADPKCKQVIKRSVADATTAILSNVIDGYTIPGRSGAPMSLGRDAAGKTGTTDTYAAVWFLGFTPDIAGAVWVGDPRGGFAHPMRNVVINGQFYSKVFGRDMPGPIWREAMSGALEGTDAKKFELENEWNVDAARHRGAPGMGAYNGGGNGSANGGFNNGGFNNGGFNNGGFNNNGGNNGFNTGGNNGGGQTFQPQASPSFQVQVNPNG